MPKVEPKATPTVRKPNLSKLAKTEHSRRATLYIPGGFTYIKPVMQGSQAQIHLLARYDGQLFVLKAPRVENSGIEREYKFLQEVHKASRHANVVRPIEYFPLAGSILLEWAKADVFTLLINQGRMSAAMLLTMASHVQNGLAAIHHSNVVHMDIKPENILTFPDEHGTITFKVADLGLSCLRNTLLLDDKPGSEGYAAPELIASELVVATPLLDMWSFGVTLLVASLGNRPWKLASPEDDKYVHFWSVSEDVRFAEISPIIVPIVQSILCVKPSERKWHNTEKY